MTNFLALLVIIGLAAKIALFFGKRIEETIIMAIFGIILVLYVFGLIGLLNFGWWFLIVCGLACLLSLLMQVRSKDLSLLFTPGLLFILATFVISIILSHNRVVMTFDEFNHWFAAAKNTYLIDALHTADESNLMSKSYAPATTLLHYFWLKFDTNFNEAYVFVSMNFLITALMAPVFKFFTWRNLKAAIFTTFLLLLVPLSMYANIFTGAYVDGLMGLVLAYIFLNYLEKNPDLYNLLCISTALFVLPIIKNSGVFLAIIAAIIFMITYNRSSQNKNA